MSILDSEAQRIELDFASLSRAEVEVFRIDPALAPALNDAYWRFMMFAGGTTGGTAEEEAQAEWDRRRFPDYVSKASKGWDHALPIRFMHEECGLPYDQAHAWVRKVEAQEWRQSLYELSEAEASADYMRRQR